MFQCLFSSFVIDYVIRQKIDKNLRLPFLETLPLPRLKPAGDSRDFFQNLVYRCARLTCTGPQFAALWEKAYDDAWQIGEILYPDGPAAARSYGPRNEQDLREELIGHVSEMGPTWKQNFGLYSRLPDRRDTGDRAQLRAEIDAYVAHLYGLSRDDFAYILDTFPVLKKKEEKAFGEFMSKRKCLEEYDRIKTIMNAE